MFESCGDQDVINSLICAVREGRLERTRELINSYGLSLGLTHSPEWSEGYVLLCEAVKNEHAEVAKLLLTSGARVNSIYKSPSNGTPLLFAVINGDIEIVKIVLDKGANIDAVDYDGRTPLHYAVMNGDIEIVKMILDKGPIIEFKNNYDRTPLHDAIENSKMEVTELLLKHGADVNAVDHDGITPLHLATEEGHETVKLLLQHGASVKENILHRARDAEVVKVLLEFGAGINSRDDYGRTALHIASEERNKDVVVTLLEYGADINITCCNGHTALDLTMPGMRISYGSNDEDYYNPDHAEVIKTLIRHIVKMKTANLYVSEKNLLSISSSDELSNFQDECEKEIASMKSEKIHNLTISFYDILAKGTSLLAIYMRNENIVQVLKSDEYKTKFPIYASMVQRNFRKGMERKELLEPGYKIFHFLFNNFPELQYNCIEKIFSYLSDTDLRILMDACKPLGICNPNSNINDVMITSSISPVKNFQVKE